MNTWVKQNSGFAILGILFILVVLAMTGAYMVKMGAANHAVVNLTLIELRAKYAAKSAMVLARKQWEQDYQCPTHVIYFKEPNTALNGFEIHFSCEAIVNAVPDNPHFHALHVTAVAKKGQLGQREYVNTQLREWFISAS